MLRKRAFLQWCSICRSFAQCPGLVCNVKELCSVHVHGNIPNPVVICYSYADYSVRHLNNENDNNKATKYALI